MPHRPMFFNRLALTYRGRKSVLREALIKYCFEGDRLQSVRNVEQMNPALAAEGHDFDLIRVSLAISN